MVEKFIGCVQTVNYLEPSSVCSTRKGRRNFCHYILSQICNTKQVFSLHEPQNHFTRRPIWARDLISDI